MRLGYDALVRYGRKRFWSRGYAHARLAWWTSWIEPCALYADQIYCLELRVLKSLNPPTSLLRVLWIQEEVASLLQSGLKLGVTRDVVNNLLLVMCLGCSAGCCREVGCAS